MNEYCVIKWGDLYLAEHKYIEDILKDVSAYSKIHAIIGSSKCEIYTTYLGCIMVWTDNIHYALQIENMSKTEFKINVLYMDMRMSKARPEITTDERIFYERFIDKDKVVKYVLQQKEYPNWYYAEGGKSVIADNIEKLKNAIQNGNVVSFDATKIKDFYRACATIYNEEETTGIKLRLRPITESELYAL